VIDAQNPASRQRPRHPGRPLSSAAPPQPISDRFPALEEQEVGFSLCAPEAEAVGVAGTFNQWQPAASPMHRSEAGIWETRLRLKAGSYEYRFVVDGLWQPDTREPRTAPNPYGGINSVKNVGLDDRVDLL
jgi:1,4-alpha-glucan branching enzyme